MTDTIAEKSPQTRLPELNEQTWVASRRINALGHSVLIRTNSEDFGEVVARMMRSFEPVNGGGRDPEVTFSILIADGTTADEPHRFYRNRKLIRETNQIWKLMRLLEWQLDAFLVWNEHDHLLLHAGSVAIDGRGILIPGSSGAGKSSLTMSLLLNGAQYFSDELTAISISSGEFVAFPKALSCRDISMFPELDEDAWFGPTDEDLAEGIEPDGWKPVWFTHAEDARVGSIGASVKITHVIFPHRGDGHAPQLQPISESEVMRGLLRHSINFCRVRKQGFHQLARTAGELQGYRLIGNGLAAATELVMEEVANRVA